jgi:chromosome segregation ATPase
MFIKSIVIDGFKSYGRRTEITGFDPEFNAITGKYEMPLFASDAWIFT